jgi:hypothetical protein
MSRGAQPLYHAGERLAQKDGVEIFIAEGGYTFLGPGDEVEVVRLLTVYVNLDIQPNKGRLQAEMSGALIGVLEHWYVLPWKGLHAALEALISGYPASTLNIVVQLPERLWLGSQAINDVLACFVRSTVHCTAIILALAKCPRDWQQLDHVSHFVASTGVTIEHDAKVLFKALSSFMAPFAIWEADDYEFREALGTALSPAFIAHAVWNHDEQQLKFMSEQDGDLIANADCIFVAAFNFDDGTKMAIPLMNQLRKTCPNAFLGGSITSGFFKKDEADELPRNCSPAIALCKTVVADDVELRHETG